MRHKSSEIILSSVMISAGLLVMPVMANAKQNEDKVAHSDGVLEEVVVTVQKRQESLINVPISVTSIQGDTLTNAGLASVGDLTTEVPGMRVDFSGAFMQPTIRGVGSAVAGTGFSTNVATYVDGFYNPSQLSTDSMFLNVERVEVLKGPQGTLFGRNATGGAILVKLREPSFQPALKVRASYGRYNDRELGFYGSDGITDTLALDLGAVYRGSDGFTDNIVTGENGVDGYDNYAIRSSALWQATDALKFKLAFQYAKNNDGRPYSTSVGVDQYGPQSQGAFFGGLAATKRGDSSAQTKTVFKSKTKAVYLTTTYDLGFAQLVSYTQYRKEENINKADWDARSVSIFEGGFEHDTKTITQEFNLSGDFENLSYVLGAYYFQSKDRQWPFRVLLGGYGPFDYYDSYSDVRAWSLFMDGTYHVTDKLSVIAGLRSSEERGKAWWAWGNGFIIAAGGAIPASLAYKHFDFDGHWHNISGRVGLSYQVTDDSNIYFTYSQGFKAGLLTPNSFETKPLKPETLDAYEIGYKYSSGRNRITASVYYYDYKDLQVAVYVGGAGLYRNAATSTIKGAELEWTSVLTDHINFNLGVAYTHAEYDKFKDAPGFFRDLRPLVNGAPNPTYGGFQTINVDASGFQMQRAPKWTANMRLQYHVPFASGELHLSGSLYYTSKFPWDTAQRFWEDSYSIVNLRAAWRDTSNHWEYAIYGRNVTDEKYRTQVLPQPPSVQQTFGEPANYGVSVQYTY